TTIGTTPVGDGGSDAEVIGESATIGTTPVGDGGSDAEVIGESNALDLVDEVLEALDQDELERAEELAERLEGPARPDEV
ncbi:MAG: hypothetical protein KTV16_14515, partial [Acidimicrobiia bacterium]|nr:hypothetical protein [Acidimicrobiia bacterium]